MCGIAGLYRLDGTSVPASVLDRMTDSLAHRGPDGRGTWIAGSIGLGHRRLAIRGLGPEGHQPMSDPQGEIWVSFNGEIYNDQALARELERDFGLRRRSTCDTEIIPLGYRAWGEGVFGRLEGMFAIALWDAAKRRLLLARDGIGIKPLYVQQDARALRFASEIKAILADGDAGRELDRAALLKFIAQGYTGPRDSLLADVRQVAPGTVEIFEDGKRRAFSFWTPRRTGEIRDMGEAVERLDATLSAVISDMLVSDVPLGVLQSGGIDSSLISLSLPKGVSVPLFTAGFAEASHDESHLARQIAAATGYPHHIVPIEDGAAPQDTFADMVRAVDGQLFDSSGYAFLILSRHVRRQVKVVLSGDGADEFLGGYPTYGVTRFAARFGRFVPARLAAWAGERLWRASGGEESRLPAAEVASRLLLGLPWGLNGHARWRRLTTDAILRRILGPELARLDGDPFAEYEAALQGEGDAQDRALLADQRHYLPADMLRKVDAMSMAVGLEVRVPFLDRRVMDLAGRFHHALLFGTGGQGKRVARRLARLKGAPAALTDAKKRGFNVPVAQLLRGPLARMADETFHRESDRYYPYLEPHAIASLWREHREGIANHGYLLWALLVFGLWRRA